MTLYVVQARGTDPASLVGASFVPDGFSKAAFVLGQIWLIYHRLWVPLLVWVALEAAYVALVFPHVPGGVSIAVDALAHLYVGLEGNRLRERKQARRAAVTELVEANDRDAAEAIFYARHGSAETAA